MSSPRYRIRLEPGLTVTTSDRELIMRRSRDGYRVTPVADSEA